MEPTTPSDEAIRLQLERIVASATFHGALRASQLLRFLVAQTLRGQGRTLKEFTVGVDGLGRGASYDPRTDSIARVEASRLRNRLDLYYAKEGVADAVLISLPRGTYVPVFALLTSGVRPHAAAPRDRGRSTRARWVAGALLLLVMAGFALHVGLGSSPPARSLAVLPFGTEPQTEYLAEGITEDLINHLSRLSRLRVTPRSVAFDTRDWPDGPVRKGRQLNVGTVVTGRVALREGLLSVQVEMVDTATGSQIWGERYERRQGDLLAVQEEIAIQIANRLSPTRSGAEHEQLTKRYTNDPEAYQLYLQGMFLASKPTQQGIRKAIDYYTRAIAKDPQFALAYVGLATCFELQSAEEGPGTLLQAAKAAATRAIEIDDTLAEAHAELGFLKWIHDLDLVGAERELRLALQLDPASASAHFDYSRVLAENGRFEQALEEANRAIELEPLSIQTRKRLPYVLFLAGRYDEAIAEYRKLIELAPDFVQAQRELGLAYEQKGMLELALRQFLLVSAMPENYASTMARADIGHLYAVAGRHAEAKAILAELIDRSAHAYVSAYDIAAIYAGLDEIGHAFSWLSKAIEQRPFFIGWLNVDPRLDRLRKDSRFAELLRSLNSVPRTSS